MEEGGLNHLSELFNLLFTAANVAVSHVRFLFNLKRKIRDFYFSVCPPPGGGQKYEILRGSGKNDYKPKQKKGRKNRKKGKEKKEKGKKGKEKGKKKGEKEGNRKKKKEKDGFWLTQENKQYLFGAKIIFSPGKVF